MARSEEHRNRWAWGLTIVLSVLIFFSFAFYKGYFNFWGNNMTSISQTAGVISAESVPSPIQSTKETFSAAFEEIGKKYQEFKDSISAVFVPFITGIEVYERK